MPVYNCEIYLAESIESILNQTFNNFEFLIIDDGSSDRSLEIVRSFDDTRIRLVCNDENSGLTECLNIGLQMARGEYIARMDADDISLPQRLKKQIQYLNENPQSAAVGCFWETIDTDSKTKDCTYLPVREHTCSFMIFGWGEQPIGHPCSTYRTEVIRQLDGYRSEYPVAEDADLWFRMISAGHKMTNIPEILFLYRTHGSQVSSKRKHIQDESHTMALACFLSNELNRVVPPKEAALIRPVNFDEVHLYNYAQIDKMLSLKQQTISAFFSQADLSPLETSDCMVLLWKSLLPLRRLKILRPTEGLLINTRFCVDLLKDQSNGKTVSKWLFIFYFFVGIHITLIKWVLKKHFKFNLSNKIYMIS